MARGHGVLIVSASAGAGHLRAAEALREALVALGGLRRVEHVDILELGPRWMHRAYGGGYELVASRAPWMWRELYERTDGAGLDRALWGPLAQRLLFRAFHKLVSSGDWGAVLCTHFLPGQLAGAPRRGFPPLFFAVTDFTLHRYWVQPAVRRYFTATEALAAQLRLRTGAIADATGIPVAGAFAAAGESLPHSPAGRDARAWLGFDPERPLALLMGGGRGADIEAQADAALAAGAGDLQLAIVCGRNDAARQRLLARALPADRVRVLGHVRSIPMLMTAADLVVSKPGGLTCAEALAIGRPLVLTRPVPGHEEANLRELVRLGAALPGTDAASLGDALRRFFAARGLRSQVTAAARTAAGGRRHRPGRRRGDPAAERSLMPLPAVHFALASDALERWHARPEQAPFDLAAPGARNAFFQGALGPDLGLFPGGEPILSQLAHSHRPGDLTRALVRSARTDLERAFAWGWLTHVIADAAIHPTVNDCARRIVLAGGGAASDEQAVAAAHSRIELGLELRMHVRQPALLRIRLAHAFDARSVSYLGDAYRSTYRLSFRPEWFLRSHRAVAPMSRALSLLVRLHSHAAPHRPRSMRRALLCTVAAAIGRHMTSGTRAFLQPLAPPRPLLRAYRHTAAEFWSLLSRYQRDGLRSLGNPDLDGRELPLPLSA